MRLPRWFIGEWHKSDATPERIECPRPGGCPGAALRLIDTAYRFSTRGADVSRDPCGWVVGCLRCGLAFTVYHSGKIETFMGAPAPPRAPSKPEDASARLRQVVGGDGDMRWP